MEIIQIIKRYWNKYKSQIILILALLVSVFFLIRGCEKQISNKRIYDNNVKALTEEVQTWKTKAGDLVAQKTVLQGDIDLLKLTNEDLYNQVKSLKARPKEVVYVETEIINEVHDTTFVIDSTYAKKNFDFSNKFRKLSGFVEYKQPNLNLNINQDIVYANFTVAIKDSKVYVTSDNPFIQYNDIQGVVIPKSEPRWTLAVGPSFSVGYDPINKKPAILVGASAVFGYNVVSFGRKK